MRKTVYQKWEMGNGKTKQRKEEDCLFWKKRDSMNFADLRLLLTKLFLISLLDIAFIAPSGVLPFPVLP